jgi:hypothetical protein
MLYDIHPVVLVTGTRLDILDLAPNVHNVQLVLLQVTYRTYDVNYSAFMALVI